MSRGSPPTDVVDFRADGSMRAQRRKVLEEQRQAASFAERFLRKVLDRTISRNQSRCALGADARDSRVAVGAVTHQRQVVRNPLRTNTEFRPHSVFVPDCLGLPVDLHDPVALNALRKVLVRRPDTYLLHLRIIARNARSGCSRGSNWARSAGSIPSPVL